MARITSADDAARAVLNLIRGVSGDHVGTAGGKRIKSSAVRKRRQGGASGADSGGGNGFITPLTQAWSLIRGGTGGALVELPIGLEGQVLAVVGGELVWTYVTSLGVPVNYITFMDGLTEYDVTDADDVPLWA